MAGDKLSELIELLDSPSVGIDGGNPNAAVWFVGVEYADRGDDNEVRGDWWNDYTGDKYYANVRALLECVGVKNADGAYLANLYPVRKPSTQSDAEIKKYGFKKLDDYYAFCDLHGRRVFRENLNRGPRRTVICNSIGFMWGFMMQLGLSHGAVRVETISNPKCVVVEFENHPGIDRMIIMEHVSRKSATYCRAVGRKIQEMADKKFL